ncbi:carboxylate--amine ligase [Micromonospora sonneratiae]|uniref:Acetyl-CoA carboxylase biotin carboxylase subunit family protein n=1 Tax=Micromonospora sonneratiae TaxID=1184706 RepID=A0ABW3Y9I1_9ACTN
MRLYLTALNPTDAVLDGFLPAASRLGLPVTVLTDQPENWPPHVPVQRCAVRDPAAVVAATTAGERPAALLSNSDHLQAVTALAAHCIGLPGKDPEAARRCKDKALTRQTVAAAGLDTVLSVIIGPGDDPGRTASRLPYPVVVKPRAGVASEDAYLVGDADELVARITEIRRRRPDPALVVEEYLAGELRTYDTLGDSTNIVPVGGWRTGLGPPPTFTEQTLEWAPPAADPAAEQVRAQLDALGVSFGASHTEYVVQDDGRVRLIEVNYRLIGDRMDLILAELLDIPIFEYVIRLHLGEPLTALAVPDPGSVPRHALVEYVCADRSGTLVAAPGAVDDHRDGVRLHCRPLSRPGSSIHRTGTNRDYLAVLHAIGPGPAAVRDTLNAFRADLRWEIS